MSNSVTLFTKQSVSSFRKYAPPDFGAQGLWNVEHATLRGGLREGVELVIVDNGKIKVAICPTRGMSIWKAWCGEMEIGWQSPVRGPVHPHFVDLGEPSGLGWLDGFDELLVRLRPRKQRRAGV